MNIGIYKDKRYRLRLEILEREKRYRKVKNDQSKESSFYSIE